MEVGFRLNKYQLSMIGKSISFYIDILKLDWKKAFYDLFDWCYSKYDINNVFTDDWEEALENYKIFLFQEGIGSNLNFYNTKCSDLVELMDMYLKFAEATYLKGSKYKLFTIELDELQIELLLLCLDLPMRIAAGQWDYLRKTILNVKYEGKELREYMKSPWILNCTYSRSTVIKAFNEEKITDRASFGISQSVLSEDIRTLYDIYKELHYQWNPQGVYDSPPWKLSRNDDPLPLIEFKLEFINEYNDNTLDYWKNFCLKKHPEYRRPYLDGEDFFIPVKQTYGGGSVVLEQVKDGDYIFRKLNRYYYISKSKIPPSILERLSERIEDEL